MSNNPSVQEILIEMNLHGLHGQIKYVEWTLGLRRTFDNGPPVDRGITVSPPIRSVLIQHRAALIEIARGQRRILNELKSGEIE